MGLNAAGWENCDDVGMSSPFDADPFRSEPSPFSASEGYLDAQYVGPERPETLPLARVSLGLGLVAIALAFFTALNAFAQLAAALELLARVSLILAPVLAVIAIISGHIGFVQADRAGQRGRGHATAGFLCGYATLVLVFIALVLSSGGGSAPGVV